MKRNKLWLVTVALLFVVAFNVAAQNKPQKPAKKNAKTEKPQPEKPAPNASEDERKVKDIVAFLEYMLNTIGSSGTPARDKDVLITESYSKIFRDAKVQVEDDLDEERHVITNKDIVAYLKDVDFFFTDAHFELAIEEIKSSAMANGQLFYKVSLRRSLTGVTSTGKPVNNTIPRYIEINYDPEIQDLKIVSIYTNVFDEREALTNWWAELSYEWQSVFKRKLSLTADSIGFNDIKNITTIEDLDLSNNRYIQNIEPLAQLFSLKLLDISHTNISDLTPIRNLTELVELNLSYTKTSDLTPLKYSTRINRLNISHTDVNDITVIEKMPALQNLEMSSIPAADFTPVRNLGGLLYLDLENTKISDLSAIQDLAQLMELNISRTLFQNIEPVQNLKNLNTLNIDSTYITNINALSELKNLKILYANYTMIQELKPLENLEHLEKVYCDQTPVTRDKANAFMAANPGVLVIFNSKDLHAWWQALSPAWQEAIRNMSDLSADPSKEELAKVTNLDSINLGGQSNIRDLEPLRRLQKLQAVIADNTGIEDLSPLQEHNDIRYLDISETDVSDIMVLGSLTKLKILKADKSKIQNIEPLHNISGLEEFYADHTSVHDITAQEFLENNPGCLIIYKTIHLNRWWKNLPANWKEVFRTQMKKDTTATRENLHRLAELEVLNFKDASVTDLSALGEFVRLKELHFSGTAINAIPALDNIKSLRSLHATNSPIQNIESVNQFTYLESLDISNTPVDDLKPVGSLQNLKSFNCAGTQIKKLDPLQNLNTLEYLDCSNTLVKQLDAIMKLPLKTLKCYNTRVSEKEVDGFKKSRPDCQVIYYR